MPVYMVEIKSRSNPVKRLIRADTARQAKNHLFDSLTNAKPVTAEELLDAIEEGMIVETAGKNGEENSPEQNLSKVFFVEEGGNGADYHHKTACPATKETPIGGPGCRCTELPMERTDERYRDSALPHEGAGR